MTGVLVRAFDTARTAEIPMIVGTSTVNTAAANFGWLEKFLQSQIAIMRVSHFTIRLPFEGRAAAESSKADAIIVSIRREVGHGFFEQARTKVGIADRVLGDTQFFGRTTGRYWLAARRV